MKIYISIKGKGAKQVIWRLLFSCILAVILTFFNVNSFKLDKTEYYGDFRYKLISNMVLIDNLTDVVIEAHCFSLYFDYPYIYTYGITGYAKTGVLPVFTSNVKIINQSYYDTLTNEKFSYIVSSLNEITGSYVSKIKVYNDFSNATHKDICIYKMLKVEGETKKEAFVRRQTDEKEPLKKMYEVRISGLNQLNQLLADS